MTSEKGQKAEVSGWLYQYIYTTEGLGAGTKNGVTSFLRNNQKNLNPATRYGTCLISQLCNAILVCDSANQERITHVKHGYNEHSSLSWYLAT